MNRMILGVVAGAVAGYAWHRVAGCSMGTCQLTSDPYISALYGAVMGLLMTGAGPAGDAPGRFQRLSVAQGVRLMDRPGTFILDVRTPREYAGGRIPGAVLVPVDELSRRLDALPTDKKTPVLVYCATGRRSQAAGRFLAERGYTAVQELKGGITAWQAEGRPVVR